MGLIYCPNSNKERKRTEGGSMDEVKKDPDGIASGQEYQRQQ